MKLTVYGYGQELPTATTLEQFALDYDLNLITIKVQCKKCGHAWGVKISDYDHTEDIPDHKFTCNDCGYYGFDDTRRDRSGEEIYGPR